MIDFYWLKSFTEIMQLFLSVLFLVYLKVKYPRSSPIITWLSVFFYIKIATDLYGILNYTSWISTIVTKPILRFYRAGMGMLELGMVTSFFLFHRSLMRKRLKVKTKDLIYFIPAWLLFPINLILMISFQSSLLIIFEVVRLIWMAVLVYVLANANKKPIRLLVGFMIAWNVLWFAEVFLHERLGLINEPISWWIFVVAELILTVGLSYFLIQIISQSTLLKLDQGADLMPTSLIRNIAKKLENAFNQQKVYRDVSLTAVSLANQLDIAPNDLSLYLNRILNKNFNQYLIDYRIDESMRLLQSPDAGGMTIEQIMLESGFNSKSVFNTAFKKKTGLTPSKFRKRKSIN